MFILPETWRPLPTDNKNKVSYLTFTQKFKQIDAFSTLRFVKYLNILLVTFYTGVGFMMFYMLNTTFSRDYAIQYHLSSGTVGLCYLRMAAGGLVRSTIGGKFADVVYIKRAAAAAANGKNVYPEMRLSLEVLGFGTFLQIAGMVTYGRCVHFNVHMAGGLVDLFF